MKISPKWQQAKDLAASANKNAVKATKDAIACGELLNQLHAEYEVEHGNNQHSRREDVPRGTSSFTLEATLSFADLVKQNTGIAKTTAYRWMGYADAFQAIKSLAAGESAKLRNGLVIRCNTAKKMLAKQAIEALEHEGAAPTRLWAGIMGEAARLDNGPQRSEPLYLVLSSEGKATGLIPDALTSIENGFKKWTKLPLDARAALRERWEEFQKAIPEDLK